jgi:hypothetical protein
MKATPGRRPLGTKKGTRLFLFFIWFRGFGRFSARGVQKHTNTKKAFWAKGKSPCKFYKKSEENKKKSSGPLASRFPPGFVLSLAVSGVSLNSE